MKDCSTRENNIEEAKLKPTISRKHKTAKPSRCSHGYGMYISIRTLPGFKAMCIYIYIYTYTQRHKYIYTCVYIYNIHMYIYMYIHTQTYTNINVHVYIYIYGSLMEHRKL